MPLTNNYNNLCKRPTHEKYIYIYIYIFIYHPVLSPLSNCVAVAYRPQSYSISFWNIMFRSVRDCIECCMSSVIIDIWNTSGFVISWEMGQGPMRYVGNTPTCFYHKVPLPFGYSPAQTKYFCKIYEYHYNRSAHHSLYQKWFGRILASKEFMQNISIPPSSPDVNTIHYSKWHLKFKTNERRNVVQYLVCCALFLTRGTLVILDLTQRKVYYYRAIFSCLKGDFKGILYLITRW